MIRVARNLPRWINGIHRSLLSNLHRLNLFSQVFWKNENAWGWSQKNFHGSFDKGV